MGKFRGVLEDSGRGGGRWIVVPAEVVAEFSEARPPVRGTVNGAPFRGRLSVYGGTTYLGLRREIREAAAIEVGDVAEVVHETRERRVAETLSRLRGTT